MTTRLYQLILALALLCPAASSQWVQTNGLYGGNVLSFAVNGSNLFAGTDSAGVFFSTNNGVDWTQAGLSNQTVLSLAVLDSNLFAGTKEGTVFRSTNNGTRWTVAWGSALPFAPPLLVSGTNLFAYDWWFGVSLMTNNGTSWTKVNTGLVGMHVNSLVAIGTNLFAGTDDDSVYLSTNNGASWTPMNSGLMTARIFCLAVSGSKLIAGTQNGVFLTTDNGANWKQMENEGLPFVPDRVPHKVWIRRLAVSGTYLFAGTDLGVFLSTNGGTNWTEANEGLPKQPNGAVPILRFAVSESNLFAAIEGAGAWRRSLITTSIENGASELPRKCELEQNFPNPCNPSSDIRYQIPAPRAAAGSEPSTVRLAVYDLLGREVAVLVDEKKEPGSYQVRFDGSGLSSGVYFYRLQVRPLDPAKGGTGNYTETKKLTLMR
jgi:photosystem II stability/assembly factor-like uncharacterized protein